jgi:hypothetical protein
LFVAVVIEMIQVDDGIEVGVVEILQGLPLATAGDPAVFLGLKQGFLVNFAPFAHLVFHGALAGAAGLLAILQGFGLGYHGAVEVVAIPIEPYGTARFIAVEAVFELAAILG